MSATLAFKPSMLRATSLVASIFQVLLMAAGVLLIVGLLGLYRGDSRTLEHLLALLPQETASVQVVPAAEPQLEEALPSAGEPLTPRMRAALEAVARRYRVSMDALEPIFTAAEASGRDLRLDPLLIVAVIAVESRFNPFSESVVGAQGLMQVIPRFHQDKLPKGADEMSFFDPVVNVQVGARVLQESIRRNGGLVPGLQQFAGAADDPDQRYAGKVLAEKARLESIAARQRARSA
ncbi:MAG: transglycosylase SLT domain-containing protein [Rhodocyclales bacterium]|nr:transglycosylase SLT domain-containing protein [Rhodocyclales bacterium]